MDHIELKPYPFPQVVDVPRLMPFQEFPFNGDGYLAAEVLRLKEAHGIRSAIETGTCLGSTAIWLAETFAEVNTAEVNDEYGHIAIQRGALVFGNKNVKCDIWPKSSIEMMREVSAGLYWLDAHWGDHCPLLDELSVIAEQWGVGSTKPCIIIHDFQVPGTDFGYDKMPDGRPFNYELVKPYIDRIYGEGKWNHNYPTQVDGAKRGWASFSPVLG